MLESLVLIAVSDTVMISLFLIAFGLLSYHLKWLSAAGSLIAILVGIITYHWSTLTNLTGLGGLSALFLFFFTAQLGSLIGRRYRRAHETRGIANILGNGLAAMIALAFGWGIGFFAALSAALSDTLSSEIGLLSRHRPRLITTLQPVPTGVDGGVSPLGLLAGLLGALLMGALYYLISSDWRASAMIVLSGLAGNLFDSVIGATLEREGIVNNMMTNFLGSSFAMIFLFILQLVLG